MRLLRTALEIVLVLTIAWFSVASSDDDSGDGAAADPGVPDPPTFTSCTVVTDCQSPILQDRCAAGHLCISGLCVWNEAKDCSAAAGAAGASGCSYGVCEPSTGNCRVAVQTAGTGCDDGNPCTTGDACNGAGQCLSGPSCDAASACIDAVCDPVYGCSYPPREAGTACPPPNACMVDTVCDGWGNCAGGARACDDGNACTQDSCDDAVGCVFTPVHNDGWSCDDGNACTGPDFCVDGVCRGAVFEDNTVCEDGNPCTGGSTCLGGICQVGVPVGDGGVCPLDDPCVVPGTARCAAGICAGGEPVVCPSDANPCTDDACQEGEGCTYPAVPMGSPCEILGACVLDGVCQNRECLPNTLVPNGTLCVDPDPCVAGSVCQDGVCRGGTPLGDGAACELGLACVVGATCQEGVCRGGEPRVCPAHYDNTCLIDVCEEPVGCVRRPTDAPIACDDGLDCTDGDGCRDGVCQGTSFCSDGRDCTVDSCTASGCVATWQESSSCPIEADCADREDDDRDGRVDCAQEYCAVSVAACATTRLLPTRVTFDDGFLPGFGATVDAVNNGAAEWAVDNTPAVPAPWSGSATLNFNDGREANILEPGEPTPVTRSAGLCCWPYPGMAETLFVTWMEWVDVPPAALAAETGIYLTRSLRFSDFDGRRPQDVVLSDDGGAPASWVRRVVPVPAGSPTQMWRVDWALTSSGLAWARGAGWFIDDVEVLAAEQCDNDIDDNANGATDCDDPLCAAVCAAR